MKLYICSQNYDFPGFENWENLLTFGEINAVTSGDFKSPAYYSVPVRYASTDVFV